METRKQSYTELQTECDELRIQLEEANDTIHAIRMGQIDAIVVQGHSGAELYSLKTADHTYRVFIEQMNEGAVTLNDAGIILYCNSRFAKMIGLPLSEVLGRSFDSFISEDCLQDFHLLHEQGRKMEVKMELRLKGPKTLICQISATPIQLPDARALSMLVTDLSNQKEVQELLKQKNKELQEAIAALESSNFDLLQFASVASHDLQEPVRKIMMFSSLIKDKVLQGHNPEEISFLLDKMINSSARMKMLISDILAYSRLTKNGRTRDQVDLNKVIEEIRDDFELVIKEKSAEIIVESLPRYLFADRGQMRQVFQNLISNSLKFSRPGIAPRIVISMEKHANEPDCVILVKDNGIGFNERYSERIFSLFQRLNTKDKFEGSGIGLAVTRKIMEKHQGTITATSEEGTGSTFRICIPW